MTLSFADARAAVLRELSHTDGGGPGVEDLALDDALERVLAEPLTADRDQPPFDRVTRDGFAVRAGDVAGAADATPVVLPVSGEVAAGAEVATRVEPGR